jgi:hypothetical protein
MRKLSVFFACCLSATIVVPHLLAERTNIAEDDASHSAYNDGWQDGKGGGSGFGPWKLVTDTAGSDSHAGSFIAKTADNQDLNGIAQGNKAFGLFANGRGFEQVVAFRPLDKPLQVGDSFSFLMENGRFEKKGEQDDPTPGAVGLVLRSGNANSTTADYNSGARFEFGFYGGKDNFQIHDGNENSDTGVKFVDSGVIVTVTLTGADTYEVEIQTMHDKQLTKLGTRKLKGSGPIESVALFNRNGEKHDVFFNGFQISRDATAQ